MIRKKNNLLLTGILTVLLNCMMLSGAQAAKPLWTFTPLTSTDISLPRGATAQVSYNVQNQSSVPKILLMKPIAGVSQSTSCDLPAHGSCILTLTVNGSALQDDVSGGPILCQQGNSLQCYQPSSTDSLRIRLLQGQPTLTPLAQNLTLSLNSSAPGAPVSDPALVGNSRVIRIQNTGALPANNLSVSNGTFPSGTAITSDTCSGATLNAGATCDITITPGGNASLDAGNNPCTTVSSTPPIPTTVTVSAENASSTSINILVLGYGCVYQDGYVFSVDDSTVDTLSISGKVAALTNQEQSPGNFLFSYGGAGIPSGATSINDGFANTNALSTPVGQYPAAQSCLSRGDWYLPAICELGRYTGSGVDAGCGTTNPNLYNSLYLQGLGNINTPFGYWCSTEANVTEAWVYFFNIGHQNFYNKNANALVRCVHAFTN